MKPQYMTAKQIVYHSVLQIQLNNMICPAQAILDAKNAAKAMPKK